MLLDNKSGGYVGAELKKRSFEGSKLAVLSSLFTIYGYAALKKEMGKLSGSRLLIEMFIQKARTYIYTTALMPAIAATMNYTIDMMIDGDDLRKNIKELIISSD